MQRAAAAPGCSSAFSARHRPRPALTQAPAPFRIATHRPTTCCSPRDRPADRPEDLTVAIGTYVYDGLVLCDVKIDLSPVRWGSGDDEDPPELSDDLVQPTYYLWWGSTTERGRFNAGGGGYATLALAQAAAEAAPGIGPTVRWLWVADAASAA